MSSKADYVRRSPNFDQRHRCHAEGCDKQIKPAMFMCSRHWFMVPTGLRNRIWASYEPGQEISKDASNVYIQTAQEAIRAVAEREGRK